MLPRPRTLIERGALWNCGVFTFKLGYILNILRALLGTTDFPLVSTRYHELPKKSFDYEVVENASSVADSAVHEGPVIEIKPGLKHSVRALTEMRIIEVQLGDLLIEEDIERFGYYWSESDRPSEEEKS